MKLQRILLRWAPAGLGLEYFEEDGTLAVLHKELPAKEDIAFAKQVRALAKQLCNEHPELLGKKRKALTAQLARLYETDTESPEALRKKVASALATATAVFNGSLERVMADEAEEEDVTEPMSSRPYSRPSSVPSVEAVLVPKPTATSAPHGLEQALVKKTRKDSKGALPPLSSVSSKSSSKVSSSGSSSSSDSEDHIAALRKEAAAALRNAAQDGTLDAVLRETVTRKDSEDTTLPVSPVSSETSSKSSSSDLSSEALRNRTASVLTSALHDGRLEQALASNARQAMREQTCCLLTAALHDGRLERALATNVHQARDDVASLRKEDHMAALRKEVADALGRAARVGILGAVLRETAPRPHKDSKDTMLQLSSASPKSSSKSLSSESFSQALRRKTTHQRTSSLREGCLMQALAKQSPEAVQCTLLGGKTRATSSEF